MPRSKLAQAARERIFPSRRFRERLSTSVSSAPDWRAWLMVAWVVVFGALYARMMIRERAPGIEAAIRRMLGTDRPSPRP